jgi:flap endonuclease GEN
VVEDGDPGKLSLLTMEEASLFEAAYPDAVAVYQKQLSETKGRKQKSERYVDVPRTRLTGVA